MSAISLRSLPPRGDRALAAGRLAAALAAIGLLIVAVLGAAEGSGAPLGLVLVGGIGLICTLLLAIARYDAAVALGFFLMGVVRFEPAPPDAVFAVVMSVAAVTGRFRLSRVPPVANWLVAALLAVNALSMIDVVSVTTGLRYAFITVYLAVFSLWLTQYMESRRQARIVVGAWLAIAALAVVVSMAATMLPIPGRDFILGSDARSDQLLLRLDGFFKDPNVFGPFLVPIAVILLEQRLAGGRRALLRMRGWLQTVLFVLLVVGIVFSFSRAAWANFVLALFVTIFVASLRRQGAKQAVRALVVLLVLAFAVGAALQATGSLTFLEERAQIQSYDTERFAAQHVGYELGWTHPAGIGPGQFPLYWPVETHSSFVRVFAEQGFGGLLAWIGIVVATLVLAIRSALLGRDTYGIGSAALLGAWCGLILNSFVVDTLHWRHLWVVAALIWAGAMVGRRIDGG
jgi:hypothetical protein